MGRPPRVFDLPLHGELSRFDVALIEGVMLWPGEDDEDQRRQAFERSVVEIVRPPGFGALPETAGGDLFALADAAYPLPAIQAWAVKPFLHGVFAGNVLHNVLDLIACDPGNASLGKAIEMAIPGARQLSSSTFKCTIAISTFNNTIWPKYRCVAHLWAAYYARAMVDNHVFPCVVDDIPAFLADAETYRALGKSQRTKRSPEKAILLAGGTILIRAQQKNDFSKTL